MFDRLAARLSALARRVRRIERREVAEFRRWVENTNNLIHLSALLFVPLLIGVVTYVSNTVTELSFLLFPPLASGAYTMFADPEGRYADPRRFVVGLTAGALCGWAALDVARVVYGAAQGIHPESAALSIVLTGVVTWVLDVEEPAAFSTSLLVLVTDRAPPEAYVVSVFVFALLVAGVFSVWRDRFYEQRARYLYETTRSDDHVLVPMPGATAEVTAVFGARLAAAHEAGKVVLLDVVDDEAIAEAERTVVEELESAERDPPAVDVTEAATERATAEAARRLEECAERIRDRFDVPCEVAVAGGDPLDATRRTAREANCDLVALPYDPGDDASESFVRGVFGGDRDAVALRSVSDRDEWTRVLVLVSRPGDTAHAMLDFASRLAGRSGQVSVCTCIDSEVERRPAETRLANLVETGEGSFETRVARADVEEFIDANASTYDLVVVGSSGERTRASRLLSPPTFRRLTEVTCDVAVVDRGAP